MPTEFDAEAVVREVTNTLSKKFEGIDPGTVESIVRAEVAELEQRPVRDYIAVLAQREAKRRLKHL